MANLTVSLDFPSEKVCSDFFSVEPKIQSAVLLILFTVQQLWHGKPTIESIASDWKSVTICLGPKVVVTSAHAEVLLDLVDIAFEATDEFGLASLRTSSAGMFLDVAMSGQRVSGKKTWKQVSETIKATIDQMTGLFRLAIHKD